MFFTQDKLDKDGYPVRDPGSSGYLATFEPARVFADLAEAQSIRRGAAHVRQLTIPGDRAAWICYPDVRPRPAPRPRPRQLRRPRPQPPQ